MHRSLQTRLQCAVMTCVLLAFLAPILMAADDHAVMESKEARADVPLSTEVSSGFWRGAGLVYAEKTPYGQMQLRYRTEIRSRWTEKNLYFLFICPYEALNLKPSPSTSTETFQLWDWDVAEVFIGSDFQNIRRYKRV